MAVKEKGEVAFEVPGAEDGDRPTVYTLKLSFTALCKIEEITGKPSTETLRRIVGNDFEFNAIRLVLYAALIEKHGGEFHRGGDVDILIERTSLEDVRVVLADVIAATWKRLAPKQWAATQAAQNENPPQASPIN